MDKDISRVWWALAHHVAWLVIIIVVCHAVMYGANQAWFLYEDMAVALEVERPVRARSDLAEVPVVGPAFPFYCDFTDMASLNFGLFRRYVGMIPVAVAVPTAFTAAKAVVASRTVITTLFSLTLAMART